MSVILNWNNYNASGMTGYMHFVSLLSEMQTNCSLVATANSVSQSTMTIENSSIKGWLCKFWKKTDSNYSIIDTYNPPDIYFTSPLINLASFEIVGQDYYYNGIITGVFKPPYSETYTFSVTSDDGVKVYINSELKLSNWTNHTETTQTFTMNLTANTDNIIEIHFYQAAGASKLSFSAQSASLPKVLLGENYITHHGMIGTTQYSPTADINKIVLNVNNLADKIASRVGNQNLLGRVTPITYLDFVSPTIYTNLKTLIDSCNNFDNYGDGYADGYVDSPYSDYSSPEPIYANCGYGDCTGYNDCYSPPG